MPRVQTPVTDSFVAARRLDQHPPLWMVHDLCMHMPQAYLDPAEFRVCLTGAVDEEASAAVTLHLLLTGPVKHKSLSSWQGAWLCRLTRASLRFLSVCIQELIPLVCQYLAAIPPGGPGTSPVARSPQDVKPLPFAFPQQPVRENVK
jgi:hypothetical protein